MVKVFKELPMKVRQERLIFKDFAATLGWKDINYRWQVPEGLNFYFKTKRYNIHSTKEMQDILSKYGVELEGNTQEPIEKRHRSVNSSSSAKENWVKSTNLMPSTKQNQAVRIKTLRYAKENSGKKIENLTSVKNDEVPEEGIKAQQAAT